MFRTTCDYGFMRSKILIQFLALSVLSVSVFADTPAPGTVSIKGGTDNTKIGNVTDSLKVNVTNSISATAVNPSVGSNSSTAPASSTQIGGVDGSGNLQPAKVDTSNRILVNGSQVTQPVSGNLGRTWSLSSSADSVNVGNFPLTFAVTQSTSPWTVAGTVNSAQSGAWTVAATQSGTWSTGRTWALSNLSDSVNVGNFPATQAVTQSTSPWVVSGTVNAAQSGAWSVGRNWLLSSATDSIAATGIGNFTVVQPTGTNLHVVVDSGPTTLTANQGTSPWVVSGTVTSNVGTTGGLALDSTVSSIDSKLTTLGQKSNTNSVPVVISNNQTAIPVSQSGAWNIASVSGPLPLPTGAATSANQLTSISSLSSIATSTSSTATNVDVALSTRATESTLSTLNSKFSSLGQKTMSSSAPVVIASDQSILPISGSVLVSNFPGTQPVSGTVTSNQGNANSVANSWPTKVTDGTNVAAVKPSMTAPTATDPALVVGISPNSPITVTSIPPTVEHITGSMTTACPTGTSCPAGSTIQIDTNGYTTVGFETHGTWDAIVTQDISYDPACTSTPNSVSWFNTASVNTVTNEVTYLDTFTNTDNNEPWVLNVSSAHCFRLRLISYTSGSVDVAVNAGTGVSQTYSVTTGNVQSNSPDQGSPIKIGGRYNSTLPTLTDGNRGDAQLDSNSRLIIAPLTSSSAVKAQLQDNNGNAITLGQHNMSSSVSVAISSDQSAVPASQSGTWNTRLQDTGGVGITSQANGTQRALDIGINVSGAQIDPRNRNWSLSSSTDSALVTQGTSNWTSNVTQFGGTNVVTGTGGSGNGIPRVTVSNDSNILATQSGTWNINNVSGTVSLPTGAATSANQTTANTSLSSIVTSTSSIDGKLNSLGQKTMTASVPVVLASDQSTINIQGTGTSGSPAGNVLTIQGAGGTSMAPVIVAGASATGATPTHNPISVSGVDTGGLKRSFLTDSSGRMTMSSNANYVNITTATTTVVKSGAGVLYAICHNTLVNNATVTLYDNTSAATPTIGKWTQLVGGGAAAPEGCHSYGGGMAFNTGLTIVTSGASDLTVIYK